MFRKSTLADCKAIYDLICDLEKKELPYERFCDIYTSQVQDKHYYCLVCEEEGAVVAVMNLRMEDQLHHAETIAEILEFSVADAYRSRERICLRSVVKLQRIGDVLKWKQLAINCERTLTDFICGKK